MGFFTQYNIMNIFPRLHRAKRKTKSKLSFHSTETVEKFVLIDIISLRKLAA